jgi:hypothetical protein
MLSIEKRSAKADEQNTSRIENTYISLLCQDYQSHKKESLCIGNPRGLRESNIDLSGNPFQLLLGAPQLVLQGLDQG